MVCRMQKFLSKLPDNPAKGKVTSIACCESRKGALYDAPSIFGNDCNVINAYRHDRWVRPWVPL